MSEQARRRELRNALAAVLNEPAGAERYRQRQRQARMGRRGVDDRPRPLEFDESGFPIRQRNPSFAVRVARLLGPS
jgi:hypothetical protein